MADLLGRVLAAWAVWRIARSLRGRETEVERIKRRLLEQMPPDLRGRMIHDLFDVMAAELAAAYEQVSSDWALYGAVYVGPEGRIDPERVQPVG